MYFPAGKLLTEVQAVPLYSSVTFNTVGFGGPDPPKTNPAVCVDALNVAADLLALFKSPPFAQPDQLYSSVAVLPPFTARLLPPHHKPAV